MKHNDKVTVGEAVKSSINYLLDFKLDYNLMPSKEGIKLYLTNSVKIKINYLNVGSDPYIEQRIDSEWKSALETPKGQFLISYYDEIYYKNQVLETSDFRPFLEKIHNSKSIAFLLREVLEKKRQDIFEVMVDNKMFELKPANIVATVLSGSKDMLEYALSKGLNINGDNSMLLLIAVASELPEMQLFLADRGAKFSPEHPLYKAPSAQWIISYSNAKEIHDNLHEELSQKPVTKKAKI
jgi:hypothetical protein